MHVLASLSTAVSALQTGHLIISFECGATNSLRNKKQGHGRAVLEQAFFAFLTFVHSIHASTIRSRKAYDLDRRSNLDSPQLIRAGYDRLHDGLSLLQAPVVLYSN